MPLANRSANLRRTGRWGNALLSLGLVRGDRVLLFLDDTPVYPAAFFAAVRAGLAPLLINLLTPPDLLQFYLADSGAKVAVAEATFCDRFNATACANTLLETLITVNGEAGSAVPVRTITASSWLSAFSDRLDSADTHRNEMAFWMYSSGSPSFALTDVPPGTATLQFAMTDLNVPNFHHGGGTVAYSGQTAVPCGASASGFTGPSPPPGQVHTYQFSIKALGPNGAVLATTTTRRKFPE